MVATVVRVGVEEDVFDALGQVEQQERGQRQPTSLQGGLTLLIGDLGSRDEAEGCHQPNLRHEPQRAMLLLEK